MKKSFTDFLKANFSAIITIVVIVVLTLASYVLLGITAKFTTDFWANLIIVFLLQVLMIILWIPEGKKRGAEDNGYKTVKDQCNKKVAEAESRYEELDEFCRYATESNRKTYITNKLKRYGVNYALCADAAYLEGLTEKQRAKIAVVERKSLSAVREIKSVEITTNSSIAFTYDVKNHEGKAQVITTAIKLLSSIISSFVGAVITWGDTAFTWAKTARLFYYIAITCLTVAFSIRTGISLVVSTRKDFFVRTIDFLERFDDWRERATAIQKKASDTDA